MIFDDIPWENLEKYKKQWFGCQKIIDVADKYMAKKEIKLGVPAIYLSNEKIFLDSWMKENVIQVELMGKLY